MGSRHRSFVFLLGMGLAAAVVSPGLAQDDQRSIIEKNLASYSRETAEGYLRPLSDGFGQSLNTGFFTSAAIPDVDEFGVRFELHAGSVFFKDSDRTFEASTGGSFQPEARKKVATVVGPGDAESVSGEGGTEFVFPGGLDLGSVSIVVPQLTLGTWRGTQGVIRWIAIDSGTSDVGDIDLLGFGVRHSISQYFPDLPVDVAGSFFYQKFRAGNHDLFDANAFSVGGQVSRSFGWWEPFGSLTLDTFRMTATYDTVDDRTQETERAQVDIDNTDVHLLAGLGFRFSLVRFHIAGNVADRFGLSGGLSIGM